jgi:hypothetical protein
MPGLARSRSYRGGQVVQREQEHERAVHALAVKDLQELVQVGRLAVLVADVLPVQGSRGAGVLVVLQDLHGPAAPVARASVSSHAEPGDRDRLSPGDQAPHARPELRGYLGENQISSPRSAA